MNEAYSRIIIDKKLCDQGALFEFWLVASRQNSKRRLATVATAPVDRQSVRALGTKLRFVSQSKWKNATKALFHLLRMLNEVRTYAMVSN